jgi:hypothetical protein
MLGMLSRKHGKFEMGDLITTRNVAEKFEHPFIILCLTRHILGDWGDLDEEDKEQNEIALLNEDRLFSAYLDRLGRKVYVITERGRGVTTILEPDEY